MVDSSFRLLFAGLLLGACATTGTGVPNSGRGLRDYFPLQARAAWSFDARPSDGPASAPASLVVLRVLRADGGDTFFATLGRGAPAVFRFADGALLRNGEPVLKEPLAVGTRWQGTAGDTYEITATGLQRRTLSGTFDHVIEVVRRGDTGPAAGNTVYQEITRYAPGVGLIEAEIPISVGEGPAREYHLELRGYTLDGN